MRVAMIRRKAEHKADVLFRRPNTRTQQEGKSVKSGRRLWRIRAGLSTKRPWNMLLVVSSSFHSRVRSNPSRWRESSRISNPARSD